MARGKQAMASCGLNPTRQQAGRLPSNIDFGSANLLAKLSQFGKSLGQITYFGFRPLHLAGGLIRLTGLFHWIKSAGLFPARQTSLTTDTQTRPPLRKVGGLAAVRTMLVVKLRMPNPSDRPHTVPTRFLCRIGKAVRNRKIRRLTREVALLSATELSTGD
jgi:hypothetical protein